MRSLVLALLIGPAALAATAAQAQTLSWPGKAPAPAHPALDDEAAAAASGVRPRAPVADARMVPASARAPARIATPLRGLRPAPLLPLYGQPSAELAPPPVQTQPVPERISRTAPSAPPPPSVPVQPPVQRASDDPMAPRADAPIYRLDAGPRDAPPPPPASQAAPDVQGARYYSLHRPTGREPDAIPQPEPVYLDALPVELIDPPRSDDMADPPEPSRVLRDANGRVVPETMSGDSW